MANPFETRSTSLSGPGIDYAPVTPDDNAKVPVEGAPVVADAQDCVIDRDSTETGTIRIDVSSAGFEPPPPMARNLTNPACDQKWRLK